MNTQENLESKTHTPCSRLSVFVLWLGLSVVACSSIFDVENPNNIVGDDILDPAAATSVVNGALSTVMGGYTYVLMVYSTVGDELQWIGSRDGYRQLDFGVIDDPLNEFSDNALKQFGPARWMTDEAVEILEMHRDSATLGNVNDLARAYLYAAFAYSAVADAFDDFALSDRKVAAPPIGEANMNSMYQTAIEYASNGLAMVSGDPVLQRNLMAMRARARYALGIWNLVGTRPISTGLLSAGDAAAAAADAAAALAMDNTDWRFDLLYDATSPYGDLGGAVNNRNELRFSDDYIVPTTDNKTRDVTASDRGIALQDPIDAIGDPRLDDMMTRFESGGQYADVTLLSARAMYLILAEDALVRGATADFEANINAVRTFSPTGLTPFVSGGVGMPTDQEMLIYERRVNLYLQGYRLHDMYRFGIRSSMWQPTSAAYTSPGTFIPITKAEIDANCHINPDWPANVPCEGG